MSAETKEVVIVAMLLLASVALHLIGESAGASTLIGAACALVVPRAGTPTRLAVVGGVVLVMGVVGCGGAGVTKPTVRAAVRIACEVADVALSGPPPSGDEEPCWVTPRKRNH